MKSINKIFFGIIVLTILAFSAWNQSLERWESDCNYGMATACSIAASMYEDGVKVEWTGKYNKHTKRVKNIKKALMLYKKACKLGDNLACKDYKRLLHGKSKTNNLHNNLNYSIKKDKKQKIYTIKGKNSCSLKFNNHNKLLSYSCKKLKNSKKITIFCTKDMKVCKTKKEILEAIKN